MLYRVQITFRDNTPARSLVYCFDDMAYDMAEVYARRADVCTVIVLNNYNGAVLAELK